MAGATGRVDGVLGPRVSVAGVVDVGGGDRVRGGCAVAGPGVGGLIYIYICRKTLFGFKPRGMRYEVCK